MNVIPLNAEPDQTFDINLGGQSCNIHVYQKTTGLFMDLSVSGVSIVAGKICRDRIKQIRYSYLGFVGDLSFIDTQGTSDPEYYGLGERYILVYTA